MSSGNSRGAKDNGSKSAHCGPWCALHPICKGVGPGEECVMLSGGSLDPVAQDVLTAKRIIDRINAFVDDNKMNIEELDDMIDAFFGVYLLLEVRKEPGLSKYRPALVRLCKLMSHMGYMVGRLYPAGVVDQKVEEA